MQLVVINIGKILGADLMVVGDISEGITIVKALIVNGVNAPLNHFRTILIHLEHP